MTAIFKGKQIVLPFRKLFSKEYLIPVIILIIAGTLYYFGAFGPHLQLSKRHFDQLPGWEQDDQSQALQAFKLSCTKILELPPQTAFGETKETASVRNWQTICHAALKLTSTDPENARRFFEAWFIPYQVKNNLNPKGLFTGYYLPAIAGSLKFDKTYNIPIYALPKDLIKVDLGLFKPELTGKKIIGRLKNQTLIPYPSRAEINNGAISQNAAVLLWTNDLVKFFVAQIQGSALVQLPNHEQKLIGYAGENGQPYTAIGRILIEKKAIPKDQMSMEAIQTWLNKNPEQINDILNQDASYVFFKFLTGSSPLGSQKIPLTPQRSLAVDTDYIPLGAPIWLSTKIPQNKANAQTIPFQHLLIAQDTGGAIKGIIRGDIYFGPGLDAEYQAGHMRQNGEYWILLPKLKS
ncbi:MAG TPA: MltA domain-containing protein [Gammaproteobacteria bacterium]|nr:MltA domain-containing protein [Gammaproteobacteria bacterium]